MRASHENVPAPMPSYMAKAYSTQRVGFLPQTEAMDTYARVSIPRFAYCIVDSQSQEPRRTAARVLRQIWREKVDKQAGDAADATGGRCGWLSLISN